MTYTTRLLICLLPLLISVSGTAQADERATFLQKVYLSFCVKHFNDYAALRAGLAEQQLPKLPPQQSQHFLQGREGDAWPVPYQGEFGQYVLVLPEGDNFCAVMARRSAPMATRQWFEQMVAQAPTPLQATRLGEKQVKTPLNGEARTESWQWATEHAPRRLLLTLTTADDPEAAIQAMVSLALATQERR
ncbi:hypothetical protein CLV44_11741 [Marinobacterium halophilum]|uniref:Uncharacterized protein n=1 Tax=Marinobacterium halophilum TaxID=267374 RepID=A0A2P8EST9_9GAMM|nr:hypothetical protein [Marinobacterium halophilum]PSL12512.1 hypothetical protein CLV44_11741 [Marinobacterium halophilum]